MHNDFTFQSLRSDEVPTSLPNQEKVYLVYQSALLLLFTICTACKMAIIDKSVSSFIFVYYTVLYELHHIGNIPAGNILTSATIVYTGSLPAKVLCVFTFLICPTIRTVPSAE